MKLLKLLIPLTYFVVGATCLSCSSNQISSTIKSSTSHTHSYSNDYCYDDLSHWNECECGNKTFIENHTLTNYYESDKDGHWNKCYFCGYRKVQPHLFETETSTKCFLCGYTKATVSSKTVAKYKPTSVTMTMYDLTKEGKVTYGFTWNSDVKAENSFIQICEGEVTDFATFAANYKEYQANSTEASTYEGDEGEVTAKYYIHKLEIELSRDTDYTYRAYERTYGGSTPLTTFKTVNPSKSSFKFAHFSDTQCAASTGYGGEAFAKQTFKNAIDGNNDFIVHTGDVVEYSKYEPFWDRMLDGNGEYVRKIPIQAISGNHETTYHCGSNETFKHFNLNIPEQDTLKGIYYSYIYGDVKFIMVNTNNVLNYQIEASQYDWLVKELDNNTCKWTIVSLHNPLYSVGAYGTLTDRNQISVALQSQLSSLFASKGVDIVLQGHDHCVSRTYPITDKEVITTETYRTVNDIEYSVNPNGTIYVMDGSSGCQPRGPQSTANLSLYKYAEASKNSSYAEYVVDGNKLTVTVKYHYNNQVCTQKQWGIIKE